MELRDVAVSSRIRLARNLSGISFMSKLNKKQEIDFLIDSTKALFENMKGFTYNKLSSLSIDKCSSLLERHIISKELIFNRDISAVALNEEEDIIIMIGEEDHLREQSITSGFDLEGAYKKLLPIDEKIIKSFKIAFDKNYGFLSSSPSNLGSAMRASVMVFLPGLTMAQKIDELYKQARQYGLTFRGIYGEGSDGVGWLYQISNQGSLGLLEEEIIDKVSDFFFEIVKLEESLRKEQFENNYIEIKDQILRAYGVLTNCYKISESEMIKLLSLIKLGDYYKILKIKDRDMFEKLYYHGSSTMVKQLNKFSKQKEENVLRAEYISKRVKNLVIGGENE